MGPQGRHLVTHIPASLSPDDNTLWQEEEKSAITEKANDAGMSPSGYLRALGLNQPIRSLVNQRAVANFAKVDGDLVRIAALLKLWLANQCCNRVSASDVDEVTVEFRDSR